MHLNLLVGLLGLASGPISGLVTARAVGDWSPSASEARDISARAPDWPKLKLEEIGSGAREGMTGVVSVEADKGKEVLKEDQVFVKVRKESAAHELEVYADLDGKDFALEVLAQIVDDDDNVIGFVNPAVERKDATKNDEDACKEVLEKLHDEGWLHMDPNRGNFFQVDGEWVIIDFTESLKVDDRTAYADRAQDDEDLDDDDWRKSQDLVSLGGLFQQKRRSI